MPLYARCNLCNKPKATSAEYHCGDCLKLQADLRARGATENWDQWEYQRQLQQAQDSRRRELGMATKLDPRHLLDRIDTSALQERLRKQT
jgi:hypothetical protein